MRDLLPNEIYLLLSDTLNDISEIRFREGKPIRYAINGVYHTLMDNGEIVLADKYMRDHILSVATSRSMYAYNDEIQCGYIAYKGGVRIGIAGEGIEDKSGVLTIKYISYINIRIPHEMKGIAASIIDKVDSIRDNVLIISPPGVGKTTILRDYVRQISNSGLNVALIDERLELSGMCQGVPMLDVGTNTDILAGITKVKAYSMAVRNMTPDVVATDEIFGTNEIDAVVDIVRAGVSIVATIHGKSIELLQNTEYFRIISLFNWVITLDMNSNNRIAKIERV